MHISRQEVKKSISRKQIFAKMKISSLCGSDRAFFCDIGSQAELLDATRRTTPAAKRGGLQQDRGCHAFLEWPAALSKFNRRVEARQAAPSGAHPAGQSAGSTGVWE